MVGTGRILLITKDFNIQGPSSYVKDLSFFMAGRGTDVHVVCYGNEECDYDLGEKIHVHQVRFILGANNTYNWHMLMNNELKRKSRELMEKNDFDLIHCIDWTAYPTAIGVSRMFDKPYVITLYSTEKERGLGVYESGMISDIEWMSTYDAGYIITLNQDTRNVLIHDYGVPSGKITLATENGKDPYEETEHVYERMLNN
ncbi:MAG: glycosyltransferase family 4 protein [Candidatus Aenigmarchaeota archaeon]|nr:glycosyltransferase family 4 protein [Candidatus Aenigmarchaeota archaeon]